MWLFFYFFVIITFRLRKSAKKLQVNYLVVNFILLQEDSNYESQVCVSF